jgi:hypothetical protein
MATTVAASDRDIELKVNSFNSAISWQSAQILATAHINSSIDQLI